MLPTFIIGLREGVEAALIVGIIAAFLAQEGRRDALRWMWTGVGAAILISAAVGIGLQILDQELPQRQQEGLETVVALVAVVMVTFMIVWMRRHARGLAGELRSGAAHALETGSVAALVGMAFFAVIREGFETAVFLLAAFQSSTDARSAGFGAVLGVVAAVGIGFGIYRGGVRLDLGRFFTFTGVVLVLIAAGLLAGAMHTAHEAGWLNSGQSQAVDLSWLVVPGTWTASLLTGMLGLQPQPTHIEAIAYLVYAVPMVLYVVWPRKAISRRVARASTVAALLLLGAVGLAACGTASGGSASHGVPTAKVTLTEAGCSPATLKLPAGSRRFEVANAGTTKVTEFEVLDGSRILGEKENVVEGISGGFVLNLEPGTYTLACPGGTSVATGTLDGTNNITAETTRSLDRHVWVDAPSPAWMRDGTYLVARRIRMLIEVWDRASLTDQEAMIGRRKFSGAPLTGRAEHDPLKLAAHGPGGTPVIPVDAHVRLAAPATNAGVRMLRRGYSFTDGFDPELGQLDAGLFFISYQNDPERFAELQDRLGSQDALNEYIKHVESAVFAVPGGVRPGGMLAEGLFA